MYIFAIFLDWIWYIRRKKSWKHYSDGQDTKIVEMNMVLNLNLADFQIYGGYGLDLDLINSAQPDLHFDLIMLFGISLQIIFFRISLQIILSLIILFGISFFFLFFVISVSEL